MSQQHDPAVQIDQTMSFAAIGNLIVNAGILENTVSRVVEWLNGDPAPGSVTFTRHLVWTELLKRLRNDSADSPIGPEVTRILEEHKVDNCTRLRNSLVHGAVDVSQPPGILINRTFRNGPDALQLGTRDQILEYSRHLSDLSVELDQLLPERYRRVSSNLVAGVVGLTRKRALAMGIDPDRPIGQQVASIDDQDDVDGPEDPDEI